LNVSTSAAPDRDPVRDAQTAEALGFDFVSASDHLHGVSPTYETWTMLAWVAAAMSRIGVATRVLGLPYRNPAVLAKMAETFDRLCGGRLILGLGAGASDEEFRGFGLGVRSPLDKIDGLEVTGRLTGGTRRCASRRDRQGLARAGLSGLGRVLTVNLPPKITRDRLTRDFIRRLIFVRDTWPGRTCNRLRRARSREGVIPAHRIEGRRSAPDLIQASEPATLAPTGGPPDPPTCA
jgi:Luciferase-like monooxygenase